MPESETTPDSWASANSRERLDNGGTAGADAATDDGALESFSRVLHLYVEAIAGLTVPIRASGRRPADLALVELAARDAKGEHDKHHTSVLYLPESVDWFTETTANRWFFKASVLFQLAPFECQTFSFSLTELDRKTGALASGQNLGRHLTAGPRLAQRAPLEVFFDRFESPALAENLFTLFEGVRCENFLRRSYGGLRRPLDQLRRRALEERPSLDGLPLRLRALEWLARQTLGAEHLEHLACRAKGQSRCALEAAEDDMLRALDRLRPPPAGTPPVDVYASARAVVDCYPSIAALEPGEGVTARAKVRAIAIPFHGPQRLGRIQRQLELRRAARLLLVDGEDRGGSDRDESAAILEQLRALLADEDAGGGLLALPEALDAECPRDSQADRNAGAAVTGLASQAIPGQTAAPSAGQLDADTMTPSPGPPPASDGGQDQETPTAQSGDEASKQELAQAIRDQMETLTPSKQFRYDEWDWQQEGYRRQWCVLHEIVLDDSGEQFVRNALDRHDAELVAIKKQLELLRPTALRTVRRLSDGEDLDLDRLVEAHTDRRAGLPLSDDVYRRRQRRERDVAAVFLLDMSASTDSPIPAGSSHLSDLSGPADSDTKAEADEKPDDADRPVMRYDFVDILAGLDPPGAAPRRDGEHQAPRRVIEVEKEALALMAAALETLGDRYAIYGFSGYGCKQVDFFVAKEFDQPFDAAAKGRVGAIRPKQSTRMGPAIRHAVAKLESEDARNRVLLVLSDGYPQDCDYGEERGSPVYGIEDTTMALREARRAGIETFCLTVDPAGQDYLRRMCPEESYLVIDDIGALAAELPKVYRGLTTGR